MTTATRYEIQSRNATETSWTDEHIGEPNEFATVAEAEEAISILLTLGEDWAAAEYRVREISNG